LGPECIEIARNFPGNVAADGSAPGLAMAA